MSKVRPDTDITVTFHRENDQWRFFEVTWREVIDDLEHEPVTVVCRGDWPISDLPTDVKTALQTAWNGMKAHRDVQQPIE